MFYSFFVYHPNMKWSEDGIQVGSSFGWICESSSVDASWKGSIPVLYLVTGRSWHPPDSLNTSQTSECVKEFLFHPFSKTHHFGCCYWYVYVGNLISRGWKTQEGQLQSYSLQVWSLDPRFFLVVQKSHYLKNVVKFGRQNWLIFLRFTCLLLNVKWALNAAISKWLSFSLLPP